MTIRHLRIFIEVAETGKMRAAADKLYITQPTVSQAIKELEEYYDVKLFERLSKRIFLTESGRKLLSHAKHIISSLDEIEDELRADRENPVLRIGSSVSVGSVLLENYIQTFLKQMPNADIRITVDNTTNIENLISNSELDIAIVEGHVVNPDILTKVIGEDELFLVVGKSHYLYKYPEISLNMLNNQDVLSREDGSVDRNQFEIFLSEHNISMNKKMSSTNVTAILNAVIAGRGIGIMSSMLIQDEIKGRKIKVLKLENNIHINRQIKLIYHKNKFISDAMNTFMNIF